MYIIGLLHEYWGILSRVEFDTARGPKFPNIHVISLLLYSNMIFEVKIGLN